MPTVFISYRRDDSAYVASMIRERLVEEFGTPSVFMDIDNIPLGVDFKSHIVDAVSKCDILLAIIGDNWLGHLPAPAARRIDDPSDFVRLEVETALARNIPVVPVLIGKADIPKSSELPPSLRPLVSRNAAEVRSGRNLAANLDALARGLRVHSRAATRAPDETGGRIEAAGRGGRQLRSSPRVVIAVVGALLAVVVLSWRAMNAGGPPAAGQAASTPGPAVSGPQVSGTARWKWDKTLPEFYVVSVIYVDERSQPTATKIQRLLESKGILVQMGSYAGSGMRIDQVGWRITYPKRYGNEALAHARQVASIIEPASAGEAKDVEAVTSDRADRRIVVHVPGGE